MFAKKGNMKQGDQGEDVEAGPLLEKEEGKQAVTQEAGKKIMGVPIQLVAGIFYCCGILFDFLWAMSFMRCRNFER